MLFLYSQDLSNYKTHNSAVSYNVRFLYSQDLSNYKTDSINFMIFSKFLYSQDLSNYKTYSSPTGRATGFCTLKI